MLIDEATSALDSQTEQQIMKNINHIIKTNKTTALIIAHRLSTIADSDLIYVLDKGVVSEKGTHDELLMNQGQYYLMWKAQQKEK